MVVDQPVHILPGFRAWRVHGAVRTVSEADRVEVLAAQALYVLGAVLNIDIRADLFLRLHETQIPVRNPILVQPLDRLAHSEAVEVVDEKAVGNYADPSPLVGDKPQVVSRAGDHGGCFEERS